MRFIVTGILFCFLVGVTVPAQAGILEFFFPFMAKKEPNLYETLEAPFADVPEEEQAEKTRVILPEEIRAARLPENAVPIDQPHRQSSYITTYVSEMVSVAMNYDGDDYKQDMAEISKLFDKVGMVEYQKFLKETNIENVLNSNKYQARGFLMDKPLLLNSGAVQGRYRWLYEVPVMVSYLDRGVKNYKDTDATNQHLSIRLQVGRQPDIDSHTGIVIEAWAGKILD